MTTDGLTPAALTMPSDWGSDYCASVIAANDGTAPVTSWTVVINLNQSAVSSLWNAASSQSGSTVAVSPRSSNPSIPVKGSASFGFCANATGSNYRPTLVSNGGAEGKISWKYVPCPVEENVSIVLKEPGNAWWNEFRVQGHRTPVPKLEVYVSGRWTEATRQPYDDWRVGSGNMGQAPWRVRVTGVLGKTIETSINTTAAEQLTSSQFPVCQ